MRLENAYPPPSKKKGEKRVEGRKDHTGGECERCRKDGDGALKEAGGGGQMVGTAGTSLLGQRGLFRGRKRQEMLRGGVGSVEEVLREG